MLRSQSDGGGAEEKSARDGGALSKSQRVVKIESLAFYHQLRLIKPKAKGGVGLGLATDGLARGLARERVGAEGTALDPLAAALDSTLKGMDNQVAWPQHDPASSLRGNSALKFVATDSGATDSHQVASRPRPGSDGDAGDTSLKETSLNDAVVFNGNGSGLLAGRLGGGGGGGDGGGGGLGPGLGGAASSSSPWLG